MSADNFLLIMLWYCTSIACAAEPQFAPPEVKLTPEAIKILEVSAELQHVFYLIMCDSVIRYRGKGCS